MKYLGLLSLLVGCVSEDDIYDNADRDGDGYPDIAAGLDGEGDCDDNDASVHPGAEDVCDGRDNDCDLDIDEDAPVLPFYVDDDGDHWGVTVDAVQACAAPDGYAAEPGDCDDNDPNIHPEQTEIPYDDVDDDCDGSDLTDVDGDGVDGLPAGGDDCDDEDATVSPEQEEAWGDHGVDNDCDGDRFDPVVWMTSDAQTWFDSDDAAAQAGQGLAYSESEQCLLVGGPLANDGVGVVYAHTPTTMGGHTLGSHAEISGAGSLTYLGSTIATSDSGWVAISSTGDSGKGAIYLMTAAAACAPGANAVDEIADNVITGETKNLYPADRMYFLDDLDGDGLQELAISASYSDLGGTDAGAIFIFYDGANASGSLSDADVILYGDEAGARMREATTASDPNGPGVPYLVVGQGSSVNYGIGVHRIPGNAMSTGPAKNSADGSIVSGAIFASARVMRVGDINGDDSDEVVVGAHSPFIFDIAQIEGVISMATSDQAVSLDGRIWTGVASPGDWDHDGYADLAFFDEFGTIDNYLYFATASELREGAVLGTLSLSATTPESGSLMARRAVLAGDMDGDGRADLAVSDPFRSGAASGAGTVFLIPSPFD